MGEHWVSAKPKQHTKTYNGGERYLRQLRRALRSFLKKKKRREIGDWGEPIYIHMEIWSALR